jgi:uncharacterized surface protein with fasciclin (FAS1) repeats
VLPGTFKAATLINAASGEDGATFATLLSGNTVQIKADTASNTVTVNDIAVAGVDGVATNGVVHVLSGVLLPPSN